MKKLVWGLILALVAFVVFILVAPTQVEPLAWTPAPAPSLDEGPFAENERLKAIERIGQIGAQGPEAVFVDAKGSVYTGFADGRIARFSAYDERHDLLANTSGRPLGLALHPDGRLIVADAKLGLIRIGKDGLVSVLSTAAEGLPFLFPDDVVVDRGGRYAYFSDASSKWGYGEDQQDVIEHGGHGRLLRYDFSSGKTTVLLRGLQFANGVALGPDEAYVLVNETSAYRVTRYWLKGDKAGRSDVFIDNLPGFPDNITFNGRDRFWIALFAPRDPLLDLFAGKPFVRKMVARALLVLPAPIKHRAMALAVNPQGQVVANLQDATNGNYSPITSVREHGDWLYFGSLTQDSLGRLPLAQALAP